MQRFIAVHFAALFRHLTGRRQHTPIHIQSILRHSSAKRWRRRGMTPVIPPKRNWKVAGEYDEALYQARHLVANSFGELKEWRGVATRYANTPASYQAICRIQALAIWARLIWPYPLESEQNSLAVPFRRTGRRRGRRRKP